MSARATRRRNKRLGIPGRLRHAAAELLSDHFDQHVDPSTIRTVEGQWRAADVYRWEVVIKLFLRPSPINFGCWETLTEFVSLGRKFGINHKLEGFGGEVYPFESQLEADRNSATAAIGSD